MEWRTGNLHCVQRARAREIRVQSRLLKELRRTITRLHEYKKFELVWELQLCKNAPEHEIEDVDGPQGWHNVSLWVAVTTVCTTVHFYVPEKLKVDSNLLKRWQEWLRRYAGESEYAMTCLNPNRLLCGKSSNDLSS